jgi:hypothetical protein
LDAAPTARVDVRVDRDLGLREAHCERRFEPASRKLYPRSMPTRRPRATRQDVCRSRPFRSRGHGDGQAIHARTAPARRGGAEIVALIP